jgi:zeaxanthin glucosyltransferase
MRTVVFVVDAIPSHLYSSMGLARELSMRGYAIEYWGDRKAERLVTEQGFGFRQLEGVWPRYQEAIRFPTDAEGLRLLFRPKLVITKFLARRQLMGRLSEALERFDISLKRALSIVRPKFVVFDAFLLAYYPYFHLQGIRGVVLSSKPLPVRDPAVPPFSSYLAPSKSKMNRARSRMAWERLRICDISNRILGAVARLMGAYTHDSLVMEAAGQCGFDLRSERVRRWITPDLHYRSVEEWALWTPQSDLPRSRQLPSNVRYAGHCVDIHRTPPAVHLDPFKGSKYLIYVCVGTVRFRWKDNVPFLSRVIKAFGNVSGIEVLISTSDERATAALGLPPDNIRIVDFAPQLDTLRVADLVITHAGAGTYRECIAHEVPMLAYPRNHDQLGNSARIEFHGLGLRGRRDSDSPEIIRRKALRILGDPSFRRRLRSLRNIVSNAQKPLMDEALAVVDSQYASSVPDERYSAIAR